MEKEYQAAQSSLELLYHISRELASALELRPVLIRILHLAINHVGGISGSIIVLDDHGKPVESAITHSGQIYDKTTRQLKATLDEGLAGWVVKNRKAALVPDTSNDVRWLQRPDDAPERSGAKSAVCAPLMVGERLVGVITLAHPTPGFFNQKHLELVQAIADQAGVAALNARLFEESKRQARIMTALAESAAAINTTLRLDDVLQRILDQISQALRVEAVSLALVNPQTNELEFRAATGLAAHDVIGTRLKLGQGVAGWVAKQGRAVIVPRVQQDPHFYSEVDRRTGFVTRSIAAAPILAQGKVIGVLEAFNPTEGAFDTDTLFVMSGIGALAGTAIHNARLFERLEAAHQRYRDLFENSVDPILITNWYGQIRGANRQACRVSGFSRRVLLQMRLDQLHDIAIEKVGEEIARLNPDSNLTFESTLRTKNGLEIPVEVHARQVDIDGVQRIQWIFRDITERKHLEHLREDLTFMIYHDLRAPLSNVNYSLEALQDMLPADSDPTLRSLIEVALRSTDRIQRLTNSLLDIHKLEAGQAIAMREPTPVHTLVQEALETVNGLAEGKNQTIQTALAADLPPVYADPDMIRRVLINLLENAIKFNRADGTITLGAKREEKQVHIWVQDQGPGIPPEEQENIFNKFARLYSQTQGFGLGLAFCQLAVEAHGGHIWVDSKPGAGATFTISLPIAPTGAPPPVATP